MLRTEPASENHAPVLCRPDPTSGRSTNKILLLAPCAPRDSDSGRRRPLPCGRFPAAAVGNCPFPALPLLLIPCSPRALPALLPRPRCRGVAFPAFPLVSPSPCLRNTSPTSRSRSLRKRDRWSRRQTNPPLESCAPAPPQPELTSSCTPSTSSRPRRASGPAHCTCVGPTGTEWAGFRRNGVCVGPW